MWQLCTQCWNRWRMRQYRRRIERALALHRRGEVRSDGLKLKAVHGRLEIEWHAREIHPWDRDLPPELQSATFEEQTLADTEAAVCRLFEALPQVDAIDLTVLEPASDTAIIAGTVLRSALRGRRSISSAGMRLRELGLSYFLAGSHGASQDYHPEVVGL